MPSPDFTRAYERYARHNPGIRHAFTESAHLTGRFAVPGDDHARTYRVPTPAHVARHLLAPALGLEAPDRALLRDALAALPRKYNGIGHPAPRWGQEHLDSTAPVTRITPYYAGLYAALNFDYADDHADNAGRPFDRDAYVDAILDAGVAAFVPELDRPARKQTPISEPRPSASEHAQAHRDRRKVAATKTARAAVTTLLTIEGALEPGASLPAATLYELARPHIGEAIDIREGLSSDELAEQRGEDGFPEVPRLPGPRTFYAVADELLGPRRRGAQGTQTYVIPTTANTSEDPIMDATIISGRAAAYRELADAIRDVTAAESARFDAQRTLYLSGDRLGALHATPSAMSSLERLATSSHSVGPPEPRRPA